MSFELLASSYKLFHIDIPFLVTLNAVKSLS